MIGKKWLKRNGCSVVVTEISNAYSKEIPDIFGFRYGETILIEAKISRSDFLSDKKKIFRQYPDQGMGNYRYYLVPLGMIKENELPTGWSLLECSKSGRIKANRVPHKKIGSFMMLKANREAERSLMYSMLRRLNTKIGDIDEIFHAHLINPKMINN